MKILSSKEYYRIKNKLDNMEKEKSHDCKSNEGRSFCSICKFGYIRMKNPLGPDVYNCSKAVCCEDFERKQDNFDVKMQYMNDSGTANINKAKVNSLEIIARMLDNKPYYELKYRQVGKKDYSIGYSSYDLKIVLGYIDTYFEIVENDNHTNADRIRNMSDEELAELMSNISTCDNCFANCNDNCSSVSDSNSRYLDWLKSEAE